MEAAGFGAGTAIDSATAHKPRRVPIAPRAPCSRSFDASIPNEDFNDLPPKPKRMHWKTYEQLVDRYEAYDNRWSLEAMRRFGMRL